MNRLLLVLLLLLPGIVSAQRWDPDSGDPPPPTNSKPLPPPVIRIDPFHLLVFEECKPDRSGLLRPTDQLRVGVISANPFISLIPFETDSSLTLTIRTDLRVNGSIPFSIPEHSFELRVVYAKDTAVYWIERSESGVLVECRSNIPSLVLEPIVSLDADIVPMQFERGSTKDDVRDFVAALKAEFGSHGDVVEIVQLDAGYYPCLTISEVEPAAITGRRRTVSINRTPVGFLVCVRVVDATQYDAVVQWVRQQH